MVLPYIPDRAPQDLLLIIPPMVARLAVEMVGVFFSSRRRHTRCLSDWSSDVCSSDLIVSSVPGVVWEAHGNPDKESQRIDYVSEHVTRMFGYSVEEWLATPNFWLTIVHPDDREAAAIHSREHFAAGDFRTNSFRWMTK